MKAKKRIRRLAEACLPARTVADIGCDHGFLGIELLCRQTCKRVIAGDLSAPSLAKAEQNFRAAGLSDRADFRVGNGLAVLSPGEAEGIVIAGMGAPLIIRILEEQSQVAKGADWLVLCPHVYPERLRSYLLRNGWHIAREDMVEDGKFYPLITACPGEGPALSEGELLWGPRTALGDRAAYLAYVENLLRRNLDRIREGGGEEEEAASLLALFDDYKKELAL